jgi:hypothetical protein
MSQARELHHISISEGAEDSIETAVVKVVQRSWISRFIRYNLPPSSRSSQRYYDSSKRWYPSTKLLGGITQKTID